MNVTVPEEKKLISTDWEPHHLLLPFDIVAVHHPLSPFILFFPTFLLISFFFFFFFFFFFLRVYSTDVLCCLILVVGIVIPNTGSGYYAGPFDYN